MRSIAGSSRALIWRSFRALHLATWLKCIPTRSPMARTPNPWAANYTTRALCAIPCGIFWARINCCNFSFSAELNTSFPLCLGIQNIQAHSPRIVTITYRDITLEKYQAVIDPNKPLASLSAKAKRDEAWGNNLRRDSGSRQRATRTFTPIVFSRAARGEQFPHLGSFREACCPPRSAW